MLVFRPLVRLLEQRGAEVLVTTRQFGQTEGLLALHDIQAELIGSHGGGSRLGKLEAMKSRLPALRRWARGRRFDIALAHGSHELTLAARLLGIPSTTTFDYEYAYWQHQLGCRAATRVVVPEAIPADRLAPYGLRPPKLRRYPGLKEEYYLSDFQPDASVVAELGVDTRRVVVVVRTPADVALYHQGIENPLFAQVLDRLGSDGGVHAVVLPRTDAQRHEIRARALPSLILPERAVDAQSLIASADLVVSAGGTMNREAVALGVPVLTTFAGRLGGVDEALIRDGRLGQLRDVRDLVLGKRSTTAERTRRDPAAMLDLLLPSSART